ncbi:MAG: hypothetical protein ACTHOI_07920 [Sphingomicrobium sp.]
MRLRVPLLIAGLALAVPALAAPQVTGQVPTRFTIRACPAVFGLSPQQAAYVTGRMRQIATAAGVPLANQPCDPNAIVIVTSNKAGLLRGLEQRHPDYFPIEWSKSRIRAVEQDPGPAVAWQFEGLITPDGLRIADTTIPSLLDPVDPGSLVQATAPTTLPASRLRPAERHDVMTSVLVVQASALSGLTTMQFADYAAMRTFARTDPRATALPASDTILKVLDAPMGTAVPMSITAQDLDFLRGYYQAGH